MVEVIRSGRPTNATLVLLPSIGSGPDMWNLDAFTRHFHVVAPELPGFGGFSGRGPFRFDDAASFVADLIGTDRGPAFVCGMSLGGMVALQLAVDHPDRVRGLVLASVTARPAPAAYRLRTAVMHATPTRRLTRPGYPRAALMAGWREVGTADFRPLLVRVAAPTLVLSGGRDPAGVRAGKALAFGIPGASFRVLPRAGHLLHEPDPAEFASTVTDFCNTIPEPKR